MTRLLVSVRNAHEADAALAGGADIIDAKEPDRGPLGRCDPAVVEGIIATVDRRAPVSIALGELGSIDLLQMTGATFAKIGLHGWRDRRDWRAELLTQIESLPTQCELIVVAYADAHHNDVTAPAVDEVVAFACCNHLHGVLIDTAIKRGATLCDWLDRGQVQEIVARCGESNVQIALAGSLDLEAIEYLMPTRPDILAVRGAACNGGRLGQVCAEKVRELAAIIHGREAILPKLKAKR